MISAVKTSFANGAGVMAELSVSSFLGVAALESVAFPRAVATIDRVAAALEAVCLQTARRDMALR